MRKQKGKISLNDRIQLPERRSIVSFLQNL